MTPTTILAALLPPRSPARECLDARRPAIVAALDAAHRAHPTCLSGFSPRSAGTSPTRCARASDAGLAVDRRHRHRGLPTDAARDFAHAFAGLRLDGRRHRPIPRWLVLPRSPRGLAVARVAALAARLSR